MSEDDGKTEAHELIVDAATSDSEAIARAVHGPMGASSNGDGRAPDPEPNAVVEHLELHRALADHDPDRLQEFLELARGEVASFRNPFDRAIALSFHLVLDEQLDPWSLDLAKFSQLYLERVRRTPSVDLITGGRLLSMAWNVLLRQTDELLARAEAHDEEPEEEILGWDDMMWDDVAGMWDEPSDPDEQYTEHVLDEENEPPISESVFHQGDRRVTLFELVEALEEGRRDSERRKRLTEERRKARQAAQADIEDEDVSGKVHKEDIEAEIHEVRERLKGYDLDEKISIHEAHAGTREDFLTVFVSSLFLSRAHMIDVEQEAFPYSPILLTPREPLHDPDVPLVGVPTGDESFDDAAEASKPDEPPAEDAPTPEQEA